MTETPSPRPPAAGKKKRHPLTRRIKRILKSRAGKWLGIRLYSGWITLCILTTRWRHEGFGAVEALLRDGQPVMLVLWHERLAMAPYIWDCSKAPLTAIASVHSVADFPVEKAARRGMNMLRLPRGDGSKVSVLREAVRRLRAGQSVLITPDGPSGPRHVAKSGAIEIAGMGGAPIVPFSYSTTRFVRIRKSWDRFILPLPFARGVFSWGAPIAVPKRLPPDDLAAMQARLAETLTALDAKCDTACGQRPE